MQTNENSRPKLKNRLINAASLFVVVFLVGCVGNKVAQRLKTDDELQSAAKGLTITFLNDQKDGKDGNKWGAPGNFYNLIDFRVLGFGHEWGQPTIYVKAKAGNRMGGVRWSEYSIGFSHDAKLEASGDRFMGLRIKHVGESLRTQLQQLN